MGPNTHCRNMVVETLVDSGAVSSEPRTASWKTWGLLAQLSTVVVVTTPLDAFTAKNAEPLLGNMVYVRKGSGDVTLNTAKPGSCSSRRTTVLGADSSGGDDEVTFRVKLLDSGGLPLSVTVNSMKWKTLPSKFMPQEAVTVPTTSPGCTDAATHGKLE